MRSNPQFLPNSPTVTAPFHSSYSLVHVTYSSATQSPNGTVPQPTRVDRTGMSCDTRYIASLPSRPRRIRLHGIFLALEKAYSCKGPICKPLMDGLAEECEPNLPKTRERDVNLTSTTDEAMSSRINNIVQNRGLVPKPECPLESTNRGLHGHHYRKPECPLESARCKIRCGQNMQVLCIGMSQRRYECPLESTYLRMTGRAGRGAADGVDQLSKWPDAAPCGALGAGCGPPRRPPVHHFPFICDYPMLTAGPGRATRQKLTISPQGGGPCAGTNSSILCATPVDCKPLVCPERPAAGALQAQSRACGGDAASDCGRCQQALLRPEFSRR